MNAPLEVSATKPAFLVTSITGVAKDEKLFPTVKSRGTRGTGGTASNGGGCSRTATKSPCGTRGTNGAKNGKSGVNASVPMVSIPELERPTFEVFDFPTVVKESGKLRAGVWFFGVKYGKNNEPNLVQSWVSSPLYIDAQTHDTQGNNFGRLVRFKPTVGAVRTWAMPMEMLAGDGAELRGCLLSMGVQIDPKNKNLFGNYLQAAPPKKVIVCVSQIGWHGDNYVLPDTVYGADPEKLTFQSSSLNEGTFLQAGTLESWRDGIGAAGMGNPVLTLSLSVGFAGALLAKCLGESGGVHFVGDSSTGKSTALEAARSIWGDEKSVSSWKATANGMEGAAALRNDNLLCLDEISEASPKEVGAIIYSLGNGVGKQRASRNGAARAPVRWRCMVLSTGERTIQTTMLEAGERTKAGQSVRLLDIPVARTYGAWDELHGHEGGQAFSDYLKQQAKQSYGVVGRVFLERLTQEGRDIPAILEALKQGLTPDDAESQEKRAAARFAVIALAGELATEYGLTGWRKGYATEAAAVCFQVWRDNRGSGNDESKKILEQVSAFLDAHGDSRFSYDDWEGVVHNRAGWWTKETRGRVYWFNAASMREALKGFDLTRGLSVLESVGAIGAANSKGERAKVKRFGGRVARYYGVTPEHLEAES